MMTLLIACVRLPSSHHALVISVKHYPLVRRNSLQLSLSASATGGEHPEIKRLFYMVRSLLRGIANFLGNDAWTVMEMELPMRLFGTLKFRLLAAAAVAVIGGVAFAAPAKAQNAFGYSEYSGEQKLNLTFTNGNSTSVATNGTQGWFSPTLTNTALAV
jgi:hypothetical protein